MRKFGVILALTMTAVLTSGCWPYYPAPCPAIAQATVVSLTVAADYAPAVKGVRLKACQDGSCKEADLELFPGSTTVDQGCERGPYGPDRVCSATSSPDGTKMGNLMLDTLTDSPMDVTATVTTTDGRRVPVRTLRFTPRGVYAYGEQCGRFVSAAVVLDATGLRQAG
ncbi:hypothetical protein [Pseudarthrobacter sp. N5]|uniref:hypothetical protein n=1 Tax=Pseudarthrobacter sp. N5 TaxID=3418416 RepID=UPI003CF135CB